MGVICRMGSVKLMDTKRIFPGADDFRRVAVSFMRSWCMNACQFDRALIDVWN